MDVCILDLADPVWIPNYQKGRKRLTKKRKCNGNRADGRRLDPQVKQAER